MAFKLIAFAAVIAVAHAGVLPAAPLAYAAPAYAAPAYAAPAYAASAYAAPAYAKFASPLTYAAPVAKYAAPIAKTVVAAEDYDPHPQYNFAYDIQDGITGDSKSQHEARDGDVVQGSYSLIDADGFKRTVEYTADPVHGFNAVVHREPLVQKAVVAKVAAPVAYAAPVAKVAAPLAYAAPVAKVAYGAPTAAYYHH